MTTYQETLDYLFSQLPMYQRSGATAMKKSLDNIIALCQHLGNPQGHYPTIHVGGTNGKGSVSHMIAAGLQANGYKVGLYTSPHYIDFRERIKINGTFIMEDEVIDFVRNHQKIIQTVKPSFFEITVAMAFDHFSKEKVDIAVIEVGLGGRLDSTNIINPILSVITNISFDHMSMLGNTLPEIAGEKAGIIKPGKPILIGERQSAVKAVFKNRSQLLNAPIYFASDSVHLDRDHGYKVTIDDRVWLRRLKTDLGGPFQERNLKTALMALYLLHKSCALKISKIKKGLTNVSKTTYYIGRWQQLDDTPLTIADSAHNEGGLKLTLKALKAIQKKQHFVIGFANDKDLSGILPLFPTTAVYYFAKANIPRGLPADELQRIASTYHLHGLAFNSVKTAVDAARVDAGIEDLVFIGGSIFVVAEALPLF